MNEKLPLLITEAIKGLQWGGEWIDALKALTDPPLFTYALLLQFSLSHFGSGNCTVLTAVECFNFSPNPLTPEKYVYFLCTL